jgi:hypothetical protein
MNTFWLASASPPGNARSTIWKNLKKPDSWNKLTGIELFTPAVSE